MSLLLLRSLPAQQIGRPDAEESFVEQQNFSGDENTGEELAGIASRLFDLNTIEEPELVALGVNTLQADLFFVYRSALGSFLHVLELQAVPGWDPDLVRRIIPFVRVADESSLAGKLRTVMRSGTHSILARYSLNSASVKSRAAGDFPGSPFSLMFRYQYNKPQSLQYGLLGEKDAGESFFRDAQKSGFDFYSAHVCLRNVGRLRNLILGDYLINMGQGLIHWQGISFGRGFDVVQVNKQAPFLRPYQSAGEVFFHRGAAIELSSKSFGLGAFISLREHDARRVTDTAGNFTGLIGSMITTGYHRNDSELKTRNVQQRFTSGARLVYQSGVMRLAMNYVYFNNLYPLQPEYRPYNFFRSSPLDASSLLSIDHRFTFRNFHFFGELASRGLRDFAFIQGLVFSASHKADVSLLYRNFPAEYHSPFGRGFAGGEPSNEKGFFAGVQASILPGLRIHFFTDHFSRPWLRYGTDAPSAGRETGIQINYRQGRRFEIYVRVNSGKNEQNNGNQLLVISPVNSVNATGIRFHVSAKVTESIELRMRAEKCRVSGPDIGASEGWLHFVDVFYKPMMKKLSGNIRLMFHGTDSYASRIYAFENDVPGLSLVRSFSGLGWGSYINIRYKASGGISIWIRYKVGAVTRLDSSDMNEFSREFRLQGLFTF